MGRPRTGCSLCVETERRFNDVPAENGARGGCGPQSDVLVEFGFGRVEELPMSAAFVCTGLSPAVSLALTSLVVSLALTSLGVSLSLTSLVVLCSSLR